MSNANVSNATIKSFATGYNVTNTVIDNTAGTVAVAQAGVVEVATICSSFFAGIKFAINERRGIKPSVPVTQDDVAALAALKAKEQAELKAAIEIFNRAHEDAPVKMPSAKKRGVA